jgi:hypothetical protein
MQLEILRSVGENEELSGKVNEEPQPDNEAPMTPMEGHKRRSRRTGNMHHRTWRKRENSPPRKCPQIFVEWRGETKISSATLDTSVGGLKHTIFHERGVPEGKQRLHVADCKTSAFLDDDTRTLREYGIDDNCTVRVSVNGKGGIKTFTAAEISRLTREAESQLSAIGQEYQLHHKHLALANKAQERYNELSLILKKDDEETAAKRSLLLGRKPEHKTSFRELVTCRLTLEYNNSLAGRTGLRESDWQRRHFDFIKPTVAVLIKELDEPNCYDIKQGFCLSLLGLYKGNLRHAPNLKFADLRRRFELAVECRSSRLANNPRDSGWFTKEDGTAWTRSGVEGEMRERSSRRRAATSVADQSMESAQTPRGSAQPQGGVDIEMEEPCEEADQGGVDIEMEEPCEEADDVPARPQVVTPEKAGQSVNREFDDSLEQSTDHETYSPSVADLVGLLSNDGLLSYVLKQLKHQTIDELFLNDQRREDSVQKVFDRYPQASNFPHPDGHKPCADQRSFAPTVDPDSLSSPTAIAYHNMLSPKMRACLRVFLFYDLKYESYKDSDKGDRVVRLLTRRKQTVEDEEVYIFFGSNQSPHWATRGIFEDNPAADFLFAMNDWLKEQLYGFINLQETEGKKWEVPQLPDDAILVSIGSGYDWHNDGQLNLYATNYEDVPSTSAEILVNTLLLGINQDNPYGALPQNANGTLDVGIAPEGDEGAVVNGSLKTFDSTIHSQGFGAQVPTYCHRASTTTQYGPSNLSMHRIVLSYRCPIFGRAKLEERLKTSSCREAAVEAMDDADHRYENWFVCSENASALLAGGTGSLSRRTVSTQLQRRKRKTKEGYETIKLDTAASPLPTAYKRFKKSVAPPGMGWEYLCRRETIEKLFKEGKAGVCVKTPAGEQDLYIGVPHLNGELIQAGKCYKLEDIEKLHHMTPRKKGSNTWPSNTPITGVIAAKRYKNDAILVSENDFLKIRGKKEGLHIFGSGGAATGGDTYNSDGKGAANVFVAHPQSLTNNHKNRAMADACGRSAVVYLYRPGKEPKTLEALGPFEIVQSGLAKISEEEKEAIQAVQLNDEELRLTSFLEEPCIANTLVPVPCDEKIIKAEYFHADGTLTGPAMFKETVEGDDIMKATGPCFKDGKKENGVDNNEHLVPSKIVRRRLASTNLDKFIGAPGAPTTPWDGKTDDQREAEEKIYREGPEARGDDKEIEDAALSIENLLNHSIKVAVAADARTNGDGQITTSEHGQQVRVLPGNPYVDLGAALRVHPICHPSRMENVTTSRFIRAVRASFGENGESLQALRERLDERWLKQHQDQAASLLFSALINQIFANPETWEDFAAYQGNTNPDGTPSSAPQPNTHSEAFWGLQIVNSTNKTRYFDFLTKEMQERGLVLRDFMSGQYTLPDLTELEHADTLLLKGLEEEILEAIKSGKGRSHVMTEVAGWFYQKFGGNEDKWKFLLMASLADMDEVTDFALGKPTSSDHVHGVGTRACLAALRRHLKAQLQEGETNTRTKTNADLLEFILEKMIDEARMSLKYRQAHGLILSRENYPVFKRGRRPLTCVDAEVLCCEVGYRPLQKTCTSRITDNPDGYSRYTRPVFLKRCSPVSDEEMKDTKERLEPYLAREKELPANIFRIPTEDTVRYSDAFDSDDESLAEDRTQRDREKMEAYLNTSDDEAEVEEEKSPTKRKAELSNPKVTSSRAKKARPTAQASPKERNVISRRPGRFPRNCKSTARYV